MENENQQQQQQQQQQPAPEQNPDVLALQKMQARYDAELQKERAKYSALLRYATQGGTTSPEEPPEPTPEEEDKMVKELAKSVRDNNIKDIQQAKNLLEIDRIREKRGLRSIFLPTDGDLSESDIESAERVKELLNYAIEVSEGNETMFHGAIGSKLADRR